MNILKIFKRKSEMPIMSNADADKDIQLIKFLKSANLSDLTLGKIDHATYELNNAEIESMGMRMAERRIYECEKEVYSQDR